MLQGSSIQPNPDTWPLTPEEIESGIQAEEIESGVQAEESESGGGISWQSQRLGIDVRQMGLESPIREIPPSAEGRKTWERMR